MDLKHVSDWSHVVEEEAQRCDSLHVPQLSDCQLLNTDVGQKIRPFRST